MKIACIIIITTLINLRNIIDIISMIFVFNDIFMAIDGIIYTTTNMAIQLVFSYIIMKNTKLIKLQDYLAFILFSVYLVLLALVTLDIPTGNLIGGKVVSYPHIIKGSVNIIPLGNIVKIFNSSSQFIQVFGNLIMLIPFGFILRYYKKVDTIRVGLKYIFLISVGIEVYQFILNLIYSIYVPIVDPIYSSTYIRGVDIDDVILNTIGGFLGVCAFTLWTKLLNRRKKKYG